jgi:hypothetical protein
MPRQKGETGSTDAKQCPWCQRWCLKDGACDYVFSCGMDFKNKFHIGAGCGRTWCWVCCKKYCHSYHNPTTGVKLPTAKNNHNANCCSSEPGFKKEDYCPGGHNPHCAKRW